jgi:hypothetical protein
VEDELPLYGKQRKPVRIPRHLQLSPVKESLPLTAGPDQQLAGSTAGATDNHSLGSDSAAFEMMDSSGKSEHVSDPTTENKAGNNNNNNNSSNSVASILPSDLQVIIKVENERLLMFVHFREANEEVKNTWKLIHFDLVEAVKTICIKVNQDLLLEDLHNTRSCNRLLEPESNEDAWRDSAGSRNRSYEFEDTEETPYLEANLNMRWVPGQFQCPEVWRTALALHPRLKMSQGPAGQSQGLQALKSALSHNIILNRSDMFVYKDDQKNIFYIKIHEQVVSGYAQNAVSRHASLVARDEDSVSRTSSVGSSKQMKKTGPPEDAAAPSGANSRSNSVGESDRTRTGGGDGGDQIVIRVFGIEEPGKNVREDLVAVLQKKLDDKAGLEKTRVFYIKKPLQWVLGFLGFFGFFYLYICLEERVFKGFLSFKNTFSCIHSY